MRYFGKAASCARMGRLTASRNNKARDRSLPRRAAHPTLFEFLIQTRRGRTAHRQNWRALIFYFLLGLESEMACFVKWASSALRTSWVIGRPVLSASFKRATRYSSGKRIMNLDRCRSRERLCGSCDIVGTSPECRWLESRQNPRADNVDNHVKIGDFCEFAPGEVSDPAMTQLSFFC